MYLHTMDTYTQFCTTHSPSVSVFGQCEHTIGVGLYQCECIITVCRFIDYGNVDVCDASSLMPMPKDICLIPVCGLNCSLKDVQLLDEWKAEYISHAPDEAGVTWLTFVNSKQALLSSNKNPNKNIMLQRKSFCVTTRGVPPAGVSWMWHALSGRGAGGYSCPGPGWGGGGGTLS